MKPAKTAGTSILRGAFNKTLKSVFHFKDNADLFLKWLNNIDDNKLESYYKFTVARNPYDRFISSSFYLGIDKYDLINGLENNTLNYNDKMHCLPQYIFSHLNDKIYVNRILRFENIQDDFNLLCDEIKVERYTLPFRNKTDHKHYDYYLNNELKNRIYNYYKNDFEKLGYLK